MGLDMNIWKITRTDLDESVVYTRSELTDCIVVYEREINDPRYQQLIPYTQKVMVKNLYYDMDKIRKDYKISSDSYIGMICDTGISVTDRETRKSVDIPQKKLEKKYIAEKVETCFVCKADEVKYWRKAYDIQYWFHEHIDVDVENTGYYILSEELLLKFNKAFDEDRLIPMEPDEESALFYWEWY